MTIQEIKQNPPLTLSIPEAAEIMGVSPKFLRAALLQGKFPFGVSVEMTQNEFYINTQRFLLYMKGSDLQIQEETL